MTEEFREAINYACALLCGWKQSPDYYYVENGKEKPVWLSPDEDDDDEYYGVPDYCGDRNALVPLWEAVRQQKGIYDFAENLGSYSCANLYSYPHAEEGYYSIICEDAISFATASPIFHCIAVLKTLGQWTEELDALYREEIEL